VQSLWIYSKRRFQRCVKHLSGWASRVSLWSEEVFRVESGTNWNITHGPYKRTSNGSTRMLMGTATFKIFMAIKGNLYFFQEINYTQIDKVDEL